MTAFEKKNLYYNKIVCTSRSNFDHPRECRNNGRTSCVLSPVPARAAPQRRWRHCTRSVRILSIIIYLNYTQWRHRLSFFPYPDRNRDNITLANRV